VREDWQSIALAVPALAAGIVYAPTVTTSSLATADVATIVVSTSGIASGTVIVSRDIGLLSSSGGKTVTLFRSVSEAGLQSIQSLGSFDSGYNMSGKWFATDGEKRFSSALPGNSRIIEVTMPSSSLDSAYFSMVEQLRIILSLMI